MKYLVYIALSLLSVAQSISQVSGQDVLKSIDSFDDVDSALINQCSCRIATVEWTRFSIRINGIHKLPEEFQVDYMQSDTSFESLEKFSVGEIRSNAIGDTLVSVKMLEIDTVLAHKVISVNISEKQYNDTAFINKVKSVKSLKDWKKHDLHNIGVLTKSEDYWTQNNELIDTIGSQIRAASLWSPVVIHWNYKEMKVYCIMVKTAPDKYFKRYKLVYLYE